MGNTTPSAWANPDAFVGRATLSGYEPYPIVSSTAYSSFAPASFQFVPWDQEAPVAMKNVVVLNSMNAVAASATSQASSGSEAYSYMLGASIFSRQDYGANSTNLSFVCGGSVGVSATLSYTSTAQSFGLSWVTDTTGGTSGVSTTSNAANWSSSGTGPKFLSVPLVTTLTAGEYWIAFQHSSTTATSNSNITLLSMSNLIQQWPVVTAGVLGASVTAASIAPGGIGNGIASAVTTNNTMAASVISVATQPLQYWWFQNL